MWQTPWGRGKHSPKGFLRDAPSLLVRKMARKPLLEQQVSTQVGVSETVVCGTAPYEDVSPSTP